jgi:RNA polymerase sigma-70 factor (ECF subfamily)
MGNGLGRGVGRSGALLRLRDTGQEQAEFTRFYETSRDVCLRAVIASTGDRELAEDLVAEAFARAWTSWRKVSHYAAPRGWVVRTALNTGISWWRPRRREVALSDHDATASADLGQGVDPAIVAALRRLPTRQREVIALRVLSTWTPLRPPRFSASPPARLRNIFPARSRRCAGASIALRRRSRPYHHDGGLQ